jgi:hypothetical protein
MNRFHQHKRLLLCLPLLFALLASTGCRGPWSKDWKVSDMWSMDAAPWSDDEDQPQTPRRMVGTWTDTVLHQTGKTPQRGFGGRLIFYGEEADKPVLVDGQLVIYAFDETNRVPTDNKPTRRYVFPADQVARRMSKTKLGPSYSFWLPWDEVGGLQTDISLIARFEPKDGALVVGEQTRHILPGKARENLQLAAGALPKLPAGVPSRPATPKLADLMAAGGGANGVQLASYEETADSQYAQGNAVQNAPSAPQRRMTTTSISLPENFRIRPNDVPASGMNLHGALAAVRAGNVVLPGNLMAQPQGPPPSYAAVATPIGVPQPGVAQPGSAWKVQPNVQPMQQLAHPQPNYPQFMTPPQSPFGNGFVAPLGPPQYAPQQPAQVTPTTVGRISPAPAAPIMPGQPPLTTAAGWATVSYPPPTALEPSFRYSPQPLQAPSTPASR